MNYERRVNKYIQELLLERNIDLDYAGELTRKIFTQTNKIIMPSFELCLDKVPHKRTEYDATISSGLAIMACHTERYRGTKEPPKRTHVKSLLKKYNNKGSVSSQVIKKISNYAK